MEDSKHSTSEGDRKTPTTTPRPENLANASTSTLAAARQNAAPAGDTQSGAGADAAPNGVGPSPLINSESAPRVGFGTGSANHEEGMRDGRLVVKAAEAALSTKALPDNVDDLSDFQKLGMELVVNRLVSGGIFLKYSRGGLRVAAHHRMVWCSPDLRTVYWGELIKTGKPSGTLQAAEISAISIGIETDVFQKQHPPPKAELCFSLVAKDRTLDLECLSAFERDMWVLSFTHLMKTAQLGAEEQKESALGQADRRMKGLSAATLRTELESIKQKLREMRSQNDRLQIALRRYKRDTTGEEVVHPKLYQDKTEEELLMYRSLLSTAKADMNYLESENKRLKHEVDKLKEDVAYLQSLQEKSLPEKEQEARRQFEKEKYNLKRELELSTIREAVKTAGNKDTFINAVTSYGVIEVPVALIPSPPPEDEYEDEEDSDQEEVVDARERVRRKAAAERQRLLAQPVHINGELITAKGDGRDQAIVDRLILEGLKFTKGTDIDAAILRRTYDGLISSVNETQLSGDAYGALSWIAGHPELVVLRLDHGAPPMLFFQVDETGILLLSRHSYEILDAKAARTASSADDATVWAVCAAAYSKKVSYTNDELLQAQILLSFTAKSSRRKTAGNDKLAAELLMRNSESKQSLKEEAKGSRSRGPSAADSTASTAAAAAAAGATAAAIPASASTLSVPGSSATSATPSPAASPSLKAAGHEQAKLQKIRLEERSKLAQLATAKDENDAGFYIIDNQWLTAWKQFIAGEKRPGPISNDRIVQPNGKPRAGLKPSVDYRALGKPLWQALHDIYGGGPVVRRDSPKLEDAT